MHFPTPHAAAAIIRQIEKAGDTGDSTDFCANVNGQEWVFEARFSLPFWPDKGDQDIDHLWWDICTLEGAWSYDDHGNVAFAGNRAETVALIGEDAVCAWECRQSESVMEAAA